jgi:pilus assembly protein Flp/PilA
MGRLTLWYGDLVSRANALLTRDEGQSLVEYALILALVSVVAITVLTTIGTNVVTKLTSVATAL